MLWKHDRPAESHSKVNRKTKIITLVLLQGFMEFYYVLLWAYIFERKGRKEKNIKISTLPASHSPVPSFPFLPFLSKTEDKLFIITFLFLPFFLKTIYTALSYLFIFFLFSTKGSSYLFLFFLFISKHDYFSFSSFSYLKLNTQFFLVTYIFLFFLFFPKHKPWMHFFMMAKIIFFTFHLCKKLGILI